MSKEIDNCCSASGLSMAGATYINKYVFCELRESLVTIHRRFRHLSERKTIRTSTSEMLCVAFCWYIPLHESVMLSVLGC
jgi:hypothetical protein